MGEIATVNREAVEAWDGVLFDRFLQYRDLIEASVRRHGEEGLRVAAPQPGERVLEVGCGFGNVSRDIAALVGPTGSVLGTDASERFIAVARREASDMGVENVAYDVGDAQTADFGGPFDLVYSRFGVMFFGQPVLALRNIRRHLRPGGRLCAVVWRRKLDNPWVHRAEEVVERYLTEPEQSDEPTCGPGPFSMANADTLTDQLVHAGFEDIALRRCDRPYRIGADLREAVQFNMALGPAGEIIRLCGAEAEAIRPKLESELSEALSEWAGDDGVVGESSTWIVTATSPD